MNSEVIAEKFHGCSFLFAKVTPASRPHSHLTLTLTLALTLTLTLTLTLPLTLHP